MFIIDFHVMFRHASVYYKYTRVFPFLFKPSAKAIEVLCKNGAYVIKRCVEGCDKPSSAQVTWSRYNGPAAAWAEAKQRAGLV